MMEEVIYGVILSAKIDIWVKEPPVRVSKNPNAVWDPTQYSK